MQIDTGADVSVISTKVLKDIFDSQRLDKYSQKLEVYDGHELTTRGKMTAVVDRNGKHQVGDIVVVESSKPFGLLGRNFLEISTEAQVNQCGTSEVKPLPVIKGVKAFLSDYATYIKAENISLLFEIQNKKTYNACSLYRCTRIQHPGTTR